ncbi:MAG TPA: PQQ-binding-like beta-propeller repeat protein [Blastocatellia bacterium]|nr:PQQ-binding-like beta-propeller repeat protein [Blastocatellia bacterium]
MTSNKSLHRFTPALLLMALVLVITGLAQGRKFVPSSPNGNGGNWPVFGRDVYGSHYNPDEKTLTPATVANLKVKWVFEALDDISSQPVVISGIVYFGSWDGKEYAVDAKTGKKVWEYDCGQSSRSAAAYENGTLYFGDIAGFLHAVDAKTGAAKWKKRVDSHPNTVATSSPIVYNGRLYIGVASHEEGAMLRNRNYECCTFRGSVVAFDAATGNEIWRWYVIPEPAKELGMDKAGKKKVRGPSGGAVWSTVSLDPAAKRVYVTTGNQYTGPVAKNANAIVALDLNTGKEVWSYQAIPRDIWNFDCRNTPDCDDLDVDFGTAPIFFKGAGGKRLLGAGQKSGWFYAVDPASGKLAWKTEVGPGGKLGGIEFGIASDGERAYAAVSNFPKQGSVSALDGATGKILWQTPSPDGKANFGPITVTGRGNDRLVWAGSSGGFMRAYDASNGKILWEFDTGGAVGGGPTVVDGTLYVGSGYKFLRIGKGNNKLYAFGL